MEGEKVPPADNNPKLAIEELAAELERARPVLNESSQRPIDLSAVGERI